MGGLFGGAKTPKYEPKKTPQKTVNSNEGPDPDALGNARKRADDATRRKSRSSLQIPLSSFGGSKSGLSI